MSFEKKKITRKNTPKYVPQKKYKVTRNTSSSKKRSSFSYIKKTIGWILTLLILGGLTLFGYIYFTILADLPSVKELENLKVPESSIVYDRNNKELYKFYKEKRTYVTYDQISKNMVSAIVAGEDKRFFENPGFDIIGLSRAVIYKLSGKKEDLGGTSTLTQQLIRNTIIENRSSTESFKQGVERKIKEIYLSYKLTSSVDKKKILELYLNKIGYGSNAYGIEEAAKTFFGVKASELNVLQSSILASLPKGPTYYSPYNHYDRLVGYIYFYPKNTGVDSASDELEKAQTKILTAEDEKKYAPNTDLLKRYLKHLTFTPNSADSDTGKLCNLDASKMKTMKNIDSNGCMSIQYSGLLNFLNDIQIENEGMLIEYQTGRKDFILGRMLEDGYITFDEYKKALNDGIGFTFDATESNIKYPHFVFYIKEQLEKEYGKDVIESGGLRIYTSLDADLQDKAQELVTAQADKNANNINARNAALISIDNETGEIIAMVGGKDYNNTAIGGNVNVTTSPLQPGSSFKPFVYALAIDTGEIGSETPVYDVRTNFPGYPPGQPNNSDGKFMGKMTITSALNASRNIPAIKMYYEAGEQEAILAHMRNLGVETMDNFMRDYKQKNGVDFTYGPSMALGTAEMTPLELASAYSVYANLGRKKDIVAIRKIEDSQGNIVREYKPEKNTGKQVMDASTAYIIDYMLSNSATRPSGWNPYLTINDRKVAAKTGTSTYQYKENGKQKILARNLWTIGYTPQITTVVWAGNTNGEPLGANAYGLTGAGPIWRDFMNYAHQNLPVKFWVQPDGVKDLSISSISGYLANSGVPENLITGSLFKNKPSKTDPGMKSVEVDILCNGIVGPNTPSSAIKNVSLVALHSLRPEDPIWENPVQEWAKNSDFLANLGVGSSFITYISDKTCERDTNAGEGFTLSSSLIGKNGISYGSNPTNISFSSIRPITKIEVAINGEITESIPVDNKTTGSINANIIVPLSLTGNIDITITAINDQYYSATQNYTLPIEGVDNTKPKISIINPARGSISLYAGDPFNLRGSITDSSPLRSTNIYLNGKAIANNLDTPDFVYGFDSTGMQPGNYTLTVEAVDNNLNVGTSSVTLTILGSANNNNNTSNEEVTTEEQTEDNTTE